MLASFFAVIHEFAVLGTSCFLLALATLWYSPVLFGGTWLRVSGVEKRAVFAETPTAFVRQLALTFSAYVVEVAVLAWLLAYAAHDGFSPLPVALVASIFAIVLTLPTTIFEDRPWQHFAIHTGFQIVFIELAVLSLSYWPW